MRITLDHACLNMERVCRCFTNHYCYDEITHALLIAYVAHEGDNVAIYPSVSQPWKRLQRFVHNNVDWIFESQITQKLECLQTATPLAWNIVSQLLLIYNAIHGDVICHACSHGSYPGNSGTDAEV